MDRMRQISALSTLWDSEDWINPINLSGNVAGTEGFLEFNGKILRNRSTCGGVQ